MCVVNAVWGAGAPDLTDNQPNRTKHDITTQPEPMHSRSEEVGVCVSREQSKGLATWCDMSTKCKEAGRLNQCGLRDTHVHAGLVHVCW